MPRPRAALIHVDEYLPVPFPPRPPPVEILPARPSQVPNGTPADHGPIVWADGGWEWIGDRYQWDTGAWVAPPRGATRTRWAIVRRTEDGQLFFAPSRWRDAAGANLAEPPKPIARAVNRQGSDE